MSRPLFHGRGPFRADQLRSGDPYEISKGHPIVCAPTGGDGVGPNLFAAAVLDTDPLVKNAGVDAGIKLADDTLRAPDIAVNLGDPRPGWITTVPPLAVEYASVGQDEDALQEKIADLLGAGTRWIWVVRLLDPQRVEVYEKGEPMRTCVRGDALSAPGVLAGEVPVAALFERDAAYEVVLQNLLGRRGYASLDAVREQGREQGLAPLEHLVTRQIGRPLADAERATLRARLDTHGAARLGDVALDLRGDALARWLADPDAV